MSINSVSGVGRIVPASVVNSRPANPTLARPSDDGFRVEVDRQTNQPVPLRFPWLSRLTRELEPASKQPSPYGVTPSLGEKLDLKA